MQYVVKRGYSYVNPETLRVIPAGQEVSGDIDEKQKWKLQSGELAQAVNPIPQVNKQALSLEELKKKREAITDIRRSLRNLDVPTQKSLDEDLAQARKEAALVKSNSVAKQKTIDKQAYEDEMDEGEET